MAAASLFGIDGVPWLEHEVLAQIAVIIVWVWGGAGFNMMVLIAGLTAIPKDLYAQSVVLFVILLVLTILQLRFARKRQ